MRRERVRFVVTPEGLDVRIDARPNLYVLAVLAAWVAVWLIGEWVLFGRLSADDAPDPDPFLFVWFCFWSAGGIVGLWIAFARLKRRELIRIGSERLSYFRDYRWFRRSIHFERGEVEDLHAVPEAEYDPVRNLRADFWGWNTGGIEFRYRGGVYRVAAHLDSRESNELAARIAALVG